MLERFSLAGKVVLITGASSGLGVAFAAGFAAAGADVVICARRADRLAETARLVEAAGRQCLALQADVTAVEDCRRVVAAALETFGAVDVLVNNAGVASARPATREEPDEFRRVIDVNVMGAYWMAQACGRVMRPGSSIVNIGSVLGSTTAGLPQAAYSSSKAAIIGLTRDLAAQWTGRKGIRVNALAPGFFPSEMVDQYEPGYLDRQVAARVPAGRPGDPAELAAAAVFLSGDAASYITGVLLPVDGGMLTT
ncbi:short-chain dehydrogenase [Frankia sp. CcI49]|uniref:SDR family NAD(P)-dependent oxidoreductase n=1 Tax=Frankia sp. CcI49 TaxID=1745382 RepID=UPI0009766FB5|nr:glucose 1-dehydrogenase [Frankia sp. CcI49]ONH58935.1 short-chain dehydrogenase [Frankia sp. CcI49]